MASRPFYPTGDYILLILCNSTIESYPMSYMFVAAETHKHTKLLVLFLFLLLLKFHTKDFQWLFISKGHWILHAL